MAEKFIIYGGRPLKGEVEIRGAKNAAFPILASTLLTKEPCIIDNLPLIEDVFKMLKILEKMGAEVCWEGKRKIKINCSKIKPWQIPFDLVGCFRGSILLLGPLLARFGKLKIPPPGGCLIGARPIDTHLDAFSQLGFKLLIKDNFYYFRQGKRKKGPGEVILDEFSVTATENVLLFSALSSEKTILRIADQDYQVQELIRVLGKMGVKIKGSGVHSLEIMGTDNPKGFQHTIISDPIETGTFIVASLATQGEVLIKKAELSFLTLFLKKLKDFGAKFRILDQQTIKVLPSKNLKIDKIQSLPYPGIHSDLQPELGVLATQTEGATLIHDPLFEGRLKYLEELNKMGADIIFCDPHRAIVYGPTQLQGIEIPSPDLRAGAALIIAGLIAKGKTVIKNIYQIDRGYEKIEERLQRLGADIKRVKN
ncbi:MAG: UDP-N-acetylglucosamine 1-carboxyvinyltransferase [Candidatus Nealsonbacteria bacterium CG10_big_fil_rev_8_21_14_0_10_36_24]|uniref:UDP-N-acetylglucosamine 1-carboxyvinyltransferase n=2 Tax=Candidatus Nealsoniibacteriota TaxID=1817911 RepID=A0A2H0YNI4_9BACT|nr:MAG: UDP-N-acetylglucosamine 1-carboxyvinyltransferase [Candidatus Nealsonbacteria bacterium CG10_big_fil_rev_8_21_14_0_10_36_24]PIS40051.1 MAG: UDP-N-acetylglucosamine 1-carboxyvinyltransferase [Candidatus Nealsonbacteria bacterium CG08_land_8_20_14_0_20_36_22]